MHNGDIRVIEEAGSYKLLVNGAHESSAYIAKFWGHALKHLQLPQPKKIKNILIFGVAGGTVIRMLARTYPHAHMIGVDIDSVMIDLGKKYFALDTIVNLSLKVADARMYIQKRHAQKYNLIVIDVYIGRDLPDFLQDMKFLRGVATMLSPQGHILVNYLRDGEYEQKAQNLENVLKDIFSEVHHTNYLNNRFFLARK